MKKNKLLFIIILVFLFPLITANGLQIINQSFTVNKTIGEDITINFVITNADSFNFYNITLENTEIGNMTKIPLLTPGNSTTATITIKTDSNFNGTLDIIGFYEAKLGTSNVTKEVNIVNDIGATPCSFSIIKGDSVKWFNTINGKDIQVKNVNDASGNMFVLLPYQNFTQKFNEPLTLNYYLYWLGWSYPNANVPRDTCTITVLNDVGYINNPEYNAKLNISVYLNYKPTTLSATFLETNYSIIVYTNDNGLFLVKNTGNNIAKRIHMENPWFVFTPNDFDLEPNYSKTVAYTISPVVQNTSDTNKNWEQIVTITGNFETITQKMNIFIPYADIDSGNYSTGQSVIELLIKYCNENPNMPMCKTNPTVIYKNSSANENMTQEQFRAIFEYMYTVFQGMIEQNTWEKEIMYNMSANITQIAIDNNITRTEVENIKAENQNANSMIYFIILGSCIFIIIAGGAWIIWYLRRERKNKELRRWS